MKNNSKEIILEFNLPEFNRSDIKIKLSKNSATIKAEKKKENKIQKKDFLHQEKIYKSFNYSTSLPDINHKKARINFNKGIIKIIAPKK